MAHPTQLSQSPSRFALSTTRTQPNRSERPIYVGDSGSSKPFYPLSPLSVNGARADRDLTEL